MTNSKEFNKRIWQLFTEPKLKTGSFDVGLLSVVSQRRKITKLQKFVRICFKILKKKKIMIAEMICAGPIELGNGAIKMASIVFLYLLQRPMDFFQRSHSFLLKR